MINRMNLITNLPSDKLNIEPIRDNNLVFKLD